MRIVIDLLGAQTISAERGIGRYSLLLTEAILRQNRDHDIWLILNAYFPERLDRIKRQLAGLIANDHIIYYSIPIFEQGESLGESHLARYGEFIREQVLASLQPDAIYLTSLFDGYGEPVVSSINQLGNRCIWAVSLYDLIPLLNPGRYLMDVNMRNWYLRKIAALKKADLLLAISESARQEGLAELDFAEAQVINVGTGVNDFFTECQIDETERTAFRAKYQVGEKFIMYSGAADPRKNLAALIEAFAMLPPAVRNLYKLVFVSKIYANEQAVLLDCAKRCGVAEQFVITGYVSDEDLRLAYHLCDLFVFPSLHEGFGLPVAEASLCGAVVIGSNATSIPEIVCMAEALFEPTDTVAIKDVMLRALTDEAFRRDNRQRCRENCLQFRWQRVADKVLAGLERCQAGRPKQRLALVLPTCMPEAARSFFSDIYAQLTACYDVKLVYISEQQATARCAALEAEPFAQKVFCLTAADQQNSLLLKLAQYYGGLLLCGELLEADLSKLFYRLPESISDELYRKYGYEALSFAEEHDRAQTLAQYPLAAPIESFAEGICCLAIHIDYLRSLYPLLEIIDINDGAWVSALSKRHNRRMMSEYDISVMCDKLGRPTAEEAYQLAAALAKNDHKLGKKQLLVDVTILSQVDAKTGIQRVVRNNLAELLQMAVTEYRIEPVWLDGGKIRYARRFTNEFLELKNPIALADEIIEARAGDIFLGLDLNLDRIKPMEPAFAALRAQGVEIQFVVYDLLPILYPQFFKGIVAELYPLWLQSISSFADRLLCISQAVADELGEYLLAEKIQRTSPLQLGFFHLGADLQTRSTKGFTAIAADLFTAMDKRASFLMVSTLEPRKGHAIIVDTFKALWARGYDVNLILVGKAGWNVDKLLNEINTSPEKDKRLFWLAGISDEFLDKVYEKADALIAASYGEGFGLPIIEAAQHNMAVIARDIPVFREVAGEQAVYFAQDSIDDIAAVLVECLENRDKMANMAIKWLTWRESTEQLLTAVAGAGGYKLYQDGKLR